MDLEILISQIQSLDGALKQEACKAVNRMLTIRNWLIGYYIVEYEQKGEDRAKYGENLLNTLAEKININGLGSRNLKLFKQFYLYYPSIVQTVSAQLKNAFNPIYQTTADKLLNSKMSIVQTVSAQLENIENQSVVIHQTLSVLFKEVKNWKLGNYKITFFEFKIGCKQ